MIGAGLLLASLLGAWELYAQVGSVDRLILPAPHEVARSLFDDRALLWANLTVTAAEIVLGLLAAVLVALVLAAAVHGSRALRGALYPLLIGSQNIPVPVIAPLLVVWLGFDLGPKVVIVALVCFFPIVVSTLNGLAGIDPDVLRLTRTLDASRWQTFLRIEVPSAVPAVFNGARIAVGVAGIAAVFAEYSGSSDGLGHLLQQSLAQLQTPRAYAAVVLLSAFPLALFGILVVAERRLVPWAPRSRPADRAAGSAALPPQSPAT